MFIIRYILLLQQTLIRPYYNNLVQITQELFCFAFIAYSTPTRIPFNYIFDDFE